MALVWPRGDSCETLDSMRICWDDVQLRMALCLSARLRKQAIALVIPARTVKRYRPGQCNMIRAKNTSSVVAQISWQLTNHGVSIGNLAGL